MSKDLGGELPAALRALLDGERLADKEGETIVLLTTSESGYPHVALLSVGEVYAPSATEVRLALWQGTESTANLTRDAKATLAIFLGDTAYYVELAAEYVGPLRLHSGPLAAFTATVGRVLADTVGYAELLGGIRFRLPDKPRVVARWRETVDALRS